MIWIRRVLLAFPFVIALVLNVLIVVFDRSLWRHHIAGYVFLFVAPWEWIVDYVSPVVLHDRLLDRIILYAVILWIPALLYSGCVWLLFWIVSRRVSRRSFS